MLGPGWWSWIAIGGSILGTYLISRGYEKDEKILHIPEKSDSMVTPEEFIQGSEEVNEALKQARMGQGKPEEEKIEEVSASPSSPIPVDNTPPVPRVPNGHPSTLGDPGMVKIAAAFEELKERMMEEYADTIRNLQPNFTLPERPIPSPEKPETPPTSTPPKDPEPPMESA